MPVKTLKKYAGYSASVIALVAVAASFIYCAGPYFPDAEFLSSMFAPEVAHQPAMSPFYRSLQPLYKDNAVFNNNDFLAANVQEWNGFFDGKVAYSDLHKMLYEEQDTKFIDTLIFYTRDAKFPISARLKRYSINAYPDVAKKLEFLYYLGFAKRCEPYVTTPNIINWGTAEPLKQTDVDARTKLIAGGAKTIASFKLPFVRQRVHFQMMRLYFMNADYTGCVNYLDAHRKEIEEGGTKLMKCRALSYAALAHYRMDHTVEAAYLFSLIYDQAPMMQKTAMHYFRPKEEKDWQRCLAMAQNPHEQCVLWLMNGFMHEDELRSIREIYKIEPGSEALDLLLVRMANVGEENYLSRHYKMMVMEWQQPRDQPLLPFEASEFMAKVVDDTRLHDRPLWYLCLGYFYQMQSKYLDANKCYDKACNLAPKDMLLNTQAHVLRIVCNTELTGKLDLKRENEILADLKWLEHKTDSAMRQETAVMAVRFTISALYKKQNDRVMEELARGFSPRFYEDDANIYKMIALIDKPDKSPMQQYLLSKYEKKKRDMVYYLGLEEVYRDNLDAARQKWTAVDKVWHMAIGADTMAEEPMAADPFMIHIRDCHDCDQATAQIHDEYTRISFLDKMIALKKKAASSPKDAADAYFQLANGFYNITYAGNNRAFYENEISSPYGYRYYRYVPDKVQDDSLWNTTFKPDIKNCDLALKYYLLARDASSDKEFKAKCTYMAAKCDHVRHEDDIFTGEYYWAKKLRPDANFGQYFKELKENYANTKYDQELLRECSYFRIYITGR